MRILVVGATGMLGHAVFETLSDSGLEVWGTVRDPGAVDLFEPRLRDRLLTGIDVLASDAIESTIRSIQPEVVINCVGVIKQLASAKDPLVVLPINSILPHRLARVCTQVGGRLIQVSTDCVFSGTRGGYRESDPPDSLELYGQSKYIGEVRDAPNAVTVRVSIIGHELASRNSLVDWFLSQPGPVPGYTRAIFSGLPTVELARVFRDFLIERPEIAGLYHVASAPISKHDLLHLVADVYGKRVSIVPSEDVVIDRSLIGERFTEATRYVAPEWPALIELMHTTRKS